MVKRAPDNHYEDPRLARVYDVTCGWSEDRDFYLALADRPRMEILDLGCGTGLIAEAYAQRDHRVVGVDPSRSMLEVARARPNGSAVQWVEAYAQDYASHRRFDLVIMTGHAFQTLLELDDVREVFHVVDRHLGSRGRFVFESRNPAVDWVARWHGHVSSWDSEFGEFRQSTHVLGRTPQTISFEHVFGFADGTLWSRSTLRFLRSDEIERLLRESGLRIGRIYGDWTRAPFDPATSDEMIFDVSR